MVRQEDSSSEENSGECDNYGTLESFECFRHREPNYLPQLSTCYSANDITSHRRGYSAEKKEKDKRENRGKGEKIHQNKNKFCYSYFLAILVLVVLLGSVQLYKWITPHELSLRSELEQLKKKYPSQNSLMWQNILKVINTTDAVQSLVILYKKDSLAADCLAKDLGRLISKIHNAEDLSLYKSISGLDAIDYGEELDYYLNVLKKTKYLIVLKLQNIPGTMAKMFHFLCEDHKENIPSHFIFTLEDVPQDNNIHARAAAILRSSWSNLLENELYPLLSRVVKNVVEMAPENVSC